MTIKEIEAKLNENKLLIEAFYEEDLSLQTVVCDSRKVTPGAVFVAIVGFESDGNAYIPMAIEKGAKLVVSAMPPPKGLANAYLQVKDDRRALAVLADDAYGHLSQKMRIIGVTGTNGKTSIVTFIQDLLHRSGLKAGLMGTIANRIEAEELHHAGRTTEEAPDIQNMLWQMHQKGATHVAMEVSSHAMELDRVYGMCFTYGIFTNLTQEHLDFHHNFEAYYQAKKKMFYQTTVANIINIDDSYGQRLYDELSREGLSKARTYSYGFHAEADYHIEITEQAIDHTVFTLRVKGKEMGAFTLPVLGDVMVANATAAIAVALFEGLPLEVIRESLQESTGVTGRMESVGIDSDIQVMVDYAHTPDALEKLLLTVRKFHSGPIHLVFGCPGDRDREKRPQMGAIAGCLANTVYLTDDNPASETSMAILKAIEEGVRKYETPYEVIPDRKTAIHKAILNANPGDLVIMAGKGHETYQIVGKAHHPHSDRKEAENALAARKRKR